MARAAIFVAVWLGCIAAGYLIPMQFNRDLGGTFAASVLMIAGAAVGPFLAIAIVRWVFR